MASETTLVPQAGAPATMPNSEGNPVPQVGVSAIILNREGKVLVGKRKGSHDQNTWQFPGGKLEFGEDLLQCGVREALEETNLRVEGIKIVAYTNDVFVADRKHFVTPFALCKMKDVDAVPVVMEEEKCESWGWWDWETLFALRDAGEMPDENNSKDSPRLFLPLKNLFLQFKDVAELKKILE